MRVIALSDTHLRHEQLAVPPCDLLVHAGDASRRGSAEELTTFVDWFSAQPGRHKVFVAGNHDLHCERESEAFRTQAAAAGIVYLQDEEVEIEGVRVFGSPVTPTFRNMAFNRDPGPPIRAHWDAIPHGLDLLVTHGPPRGICDRMVLGKHVGCVDLLETVRRVQPRVHVFGHVHEARGTGRCPGSTTQFLNVANSRFLPIGQRGPTPFDL